MNVNSSKSFREWLKETKHRPEVDENFMGYGYDESDHHIHGFFNLVHGCKADIAGFLESRLAIADDNQTIYEFVQNAADCKSTKFYSFWKEEYFLVCNNGDKFSKEGLESIINDAQSTKKNPDSIGRFGIGFKIIHRLVGELNGLDEIMNQNRGPIIFSWSNKEDILSFIHKEQPISLLHSELDDDCPYLLKILLTSFPADVEEEVYDKNHEKRVVFSKEELDECRDYVLQCLGQTIESNISDFTQGSVFFLRLGKGKKKYLDENCPSFSDGLAFSMNTLKRLSTICINNKIIEKKELCLETGTIKVNSDDFKQLTINDAYKKYDVRYSYGYVTYSCEDDSSQIENLKKSPNFYKFFPISDEINDFALFIHCDTFSISSSRRSLDDSNHNKIILRNITQFIISTLERYKQSQQDKYYQLFSAILLSEQPTAQNNKWMDDVFYSPLMDYIKRNVPTLFNTYKLSSETKIKGTALPISNPHDIGASYDWCWLENNPDGSVQKALRDSKKLNIEVKDAKALVKDGAIESWNNWLEKNNGSVSQLLEELKDAAEIAMDIKEKLKALRLFNIQSIYYSYTTITSNDNNYILLSDNTEPIKDILEKLGFKCTNDVFNESHPLWKHLNKQNEILIFQSIQEKLKETNLSKDERIRLTKAKLDGIGEETIKKANLLHNQRGDLTPMQQMLPYTEELPVWLGRYVINKEEYSNELDTYLIPIDHIFSDIVKIYYKDLISTIGDDCESSWDTLYEAFKDKWTDDFTEKIIEEYKGDTKLLTIIESRPYVQEKYLKITPNITIEPEKAYPEHSIEYRLLKLSTVSPTNAEILKNKIIFGGRTLKQYTRSNTITINKFKDKQIADITMKVSEILPQQELLEGFDVIAANFSEFRTLFAQKEMTIDEVWREIPATEFYTNPQRAFFMLRAGYCNYSSYTLVNSWLKYRDIEDYVSFVEYLYNKGNLWYDIVRAFGEPFPDAATKQLYIYSESFTLDNERASNAIEQWIDNDEKKLNFIKLFGYKDSSSEEIDRRKKFLNKERQNYTITDANINKAFLDWVSSLQLPVTDACQIEVIQAICEHSSNLVEEILDTEKLMLESIEWDNSEYLKWTKEKGIQIFLHKGDMPYNCKYVHRSDNIPYILYTTKKGTYCYQNNSLYVNGDLDLESLLGEIAGMGICDEFSIADWSEIFYQTSSQVTKLIELNRELTEANKRNSELIEQIEELKETIKRLKDDRPEGTFSFGNDDSIELAQQKERNQQACASVLRHLSDMGFRVPEMRDDFCGVIDGVIDKDGTNRPLVVISSESPEISNGKEKYHLRLNTPEWRQLLREHSMLWIRMKDNILAPIHRDELVSYYDHMTLSWDTINLNEHIDQIMSIMQYCKKVKLDVAVVDPDKTRGDLLAEYGF